MKSAKSIALKITESVQVIRALQHQNFHMLHFYFRRGQGVSLGMPDLISQVPEWGPAEDQAPHKDCSRIVGFLECPALLPKELKFLKIIS